MLGYLFVKRIQGGTSPEPSLVLQEEANGWLVMAESDGAMEEQEARRVAVEDLINECRTTFPGALVRKASLAAFDTVLNADAAAKFVGATWGAYPELKMGIKRTWYLDWPLRLREVSVGTSLTLNACNLVSN